MTIGALAELERARAADRRRRQVGAVDVEHGDVVGAVDAHDVGGLGCPSENVTVIVVGALDRVGRRQQVAVGSVDDAGAAAVTRRGLGVDAGHGREHRLGPGQLVGAGLAGHLDRHDLDRAPVRLSVSKAPTPSRIASVGAEPSSAASRADDPHRGPPPSAG